MSQPPPPLLQRQSAADALLSGPSLSSSSLTNGNKKKKTAAAAIAVSAAAAAVAKKKDTNSANKADGLNDVIIPSAAAVGGIGKKTTTRRRVMMANKNKQQLRRRHPPSLALQSVRGRNDSIIVTTTSVGGGVGRKRSSATGNIASSSSSATAKKKMGTTTTSRSSSSSSSNNIFERRNARDKVSKRMAPPTGTDMTLLALLDDDGPRRKKKKKKAVVQDYGGALMADGGRGKRQKTTTTINNNAAAYNNNNNDEEVVVMVPLPPPNMPSYHQQQSIMSNKKPRKRVSSSHDDAIRLKRDWRGKEGCGKRVGNDATKTIMPSKMTTTIPITMRDAASSQSSNTQINSTILEEGGSDSNKMAKEEEEAATTMTMDDDYKNNDHGNINLGGGGCYKKTALNPYQKSSSRRSVVGAAATFGTSCGKEGGQSNTMDSTMESSIQAMDDNNDKATTVDDAAIMMSLPAEEELMTLPLGIGGGGANKNNSKKKKRSTGSISSRVSGGTTFGSLLNGKSVPAAGRRSFGGPWNGGGEGNNTIGANGAKGGDEVSLDGHSTHDTTTTTTISSSQKQQQEQQQVDNDNNNDDDATFQAGNDDNNDNDNDQDNEEGDEDDIDKEQHQAPEWYDPEEHAQMDQEMAALQNATTNNNNYPNSTNTNYPNKSKYKSNKSKKNKGGINDNFIRLDLRNSSGSCRGARNLKKVNKQKLWRAQYRFGMGDKHGGDGSGDGSGGGGSGNGVGDIDGDNDGMGGNGVKNIGIGGIGFGNDILPGQQQQEETSRYGNQYNNNNQWGKSSGSGGGGASSGGDLKCFASARNAGVDPLDDFMDGVFSKKKKTKEDDDGSTMNGGLTSDSAAASITTTNNGSSDKGTTNNSTTMNESNNKDKKKSTSSTTTTAKRPTTRPPTTKATKNNDDATSSTTTNNKPICTRHNRPCKLLTVKRNNKGNKGRTFYVCSMPRGEQCDFFKWEEDTVEATQRALLKSSSNSGFIARQVAAARVRFKELTVPELRVEAKKRGIKWTGKKDQILTRLLIWIRDEIADSVEGEEPVPRSQGNDEEEAADEKEKDNEEEEGKDDSNDDDDDDLKSNKDGEEELEEPSNEESKMIDLDDSDDDTDESDDDGCNGDSDDEKCGNPEQTKTVAVVGKKDLFIELSDDESSYEDEASDNDANDDVDSSSDELEICHPSTTIKPATSKKPTSTTNPTLHDHLEKYFGHTTFRTGQEWAIRRTFSHQRTLLVAPTGQGKSLCYALPAALMPGICIVVSPLISLMQDQLRQLPPKIPAATLSGSMTTAQMALIVDDIMRGRYKVLFVSPERLASAAFRRLVRPKFNLETREYERQFPTVSLLCVDEAHCLSQWGHNFRPSYLRVRSLLPLIKPKSILALTATAGPMVVRDICYTLCIPFDGRSLDGGEGSLPSPMPAPSIEVDAFDKDSVKNSGRDGVSSPTAAPSMEVDTFDRDSVEDSGRDGVKVLNCDRDNIDVFSLVLQSNDERRYLLHKILKEKKKDDRSERLKKLPIEEGCLSKGSVIVYVWRQKDTEIVAEQLNGAGIRGGVVCYHGGMDSNKRSRAQSRFLRGKARICVATVAFGLGINKPDIEGVIHLCLPPSPEHYLQEIGRAGRDGRAAKAIALPLADEFVSRHSLAHSDRLSSNQLEIVFLALQKSVNEALGDIPPEAGVDLDADQIFVDGIHVAMPVTQTVDASDCKEESIETIFSLLEGDAQSEQSLLSVEGYLPDAATITLKKRSLDKLEKLEEIARSITKCGIRVDGQSEQSNQDTSNPYSKYQNFGGTAMEKGFYAYSFGTYKFSIIRCARCMGPNIEPRHVYAALRRLQGYGELELVLDTTSNGRAMHLRMKQDGIRLFHTKGGNNSDGKERTDLNENVRAIVANLSKQFSAKENVSVEKVQSMYEIMHHVSCRQNDQEEDDMSDDEDDNSSMSCQPKKSPRLVLFQKLVQNYFRGGSIHENGEDSAGTCDTSNKAPNVIKNFPLRNKRLLSCLSSDVSLLMQMLSIRRQEQMPMAVHINEQKFADYRDLCLAKILHSIDAPRAPILSWYNHVLWGKYRNYSFPSVVQAVKKTFENA